MGMKPHTNTQTYTRTHNYMEVNVGNLNIILPITGEMFG